MHRRSLERFPFDSVLSVHLVEAPLREQADIELAAHWVLGRPGAFLLTAGDLEILPLVLEAADRFHDRPSNEQMAALVSRRGS